MPKLGFEGTLGYRTGGSGNYSPINPTTDVTINMESGEADVTSRGADGWEQVLAGLKTASVEFEMIWDKADAGVQAMRQSFENGTPIELAAMDDLLSTGSGWVFEGVVMQFGRTEALREGMKCPVVIKPTYGNNPPAYVSGGVSAASGV